MLKVNYEYVNNFHDNLAVVSKNDKYGYINKNGDLVIGFIYDDALDFNSGYASVKIGESWGMIDTSGREIIKPIFEEIETVPNSRYLIIKVNEKYKLTDSLGIFINDDDYEEILYSDQLI